MNKELCIRMNNREKNIFTVKPNESGYTIEKLWGAIQNAINNNCSNFDIPAGDGIVIRTRCGIVNLWKVFFRLDNISSIELYEKEEEDE